MEDAPHEQQDDRTRQDVERLRMQELIRERGTETQIEGETQERESVGWVMFTCMLFLSLVADGAEVLTGGTLGWFVGLFADFILLVTLGFTKSGKTQFRRMLVAVLGEKIPGLNVLPLRTLFVVWIFIKSRSTVVRTLAAVSH